MRMMSRMLVIVRCVLCLRQGVEQQRLRLFEDGSLPCALLDPELLGLPQVSAAHKSGRLEPKLRFARHVLNLTDASELVRTVPQFMSAPLTTRLAPRHAAARRRGREPRSLDEVGRMLCEKGDAETCAAFRRGGRYAARAGDSVTLRDLVDHGWDARSDRDRRKASALHWAAGHGALEACGVLIDRGKVPVNDREGSGATPLHWALVGVDGNAFGVGARLEAATFLLDQRGADPRAATDDKNACVHWAAWAGGLEALRLLVRHGAELDVVNERGCGVAHWAAAGGDVDTLEFLAAQGVDLAQCNNANHTPLEHAVAYGRIEAADWFLRRGIVDSSAVQYALTLAQYQPEDTNRVAIATGLAPFRVPSL